MKVFVTGVNGQLGHDVMDELLRRGHHATGSDLAPSSDFPRYRPVNITEPGAVDKAFFRIRPDAVIHCAAWTAVDAAEDNVAAVRKINVEATGTIASACARIGAKMIYISTDYVFDGTGTEPWSSDLDCRKFTPVNVYGESKRDGELAVQAVLDRFFIVRIAWVFGLHGNNFVKTMLKAGRTHDSVRVVNDQFGTPTYTKDLARLLVDMIESDKYGVYHATNEGGFISWYDFTKEIYRLAKLDTAVLPVSTEEYGLSRAARPFNSRLDKSGLVKAGFVPLPTWQNALRRYLTELKKSGF